MILIDDHEEIVNSVMFFVIPKMQAGMILSSLRHLLDVCDTYLARLLLYSV